LAAIIGLLPAAAVADRTPVSFPAADGFRIFADYFPPPSGDQDVPMVILLHMYRGDRSTWAPLIPLLNDNGFAVLALDLRGFGESATTETAKRATDRDSTLFQEMQNDVRGAYDWLSKQPRIDRSRVALIGASVGCSVAFQYAVKDRSVDVIVALSPGVDYMGLDSVGDIRQVIGRKILMVATQDEKKAPEALKAARSDAMVSLYPGSAHGTRMFGMIPKVEWEVVEFIKLNIGQPGKAPVYASIDKDIYHQAGSGWVEKIAPSNLRVFSSAQEAESRGLRAARSTEPGDLGGKNAEKGGDRKPKPKP
jgi:pimeloyl-ACP methyl ester carboxylesterase